MSKLSERMRKYNANMRSLTPTVRQFFLDACDEIEALERKLSPVTEAKDNEQKEEGQ